MGKHVLVTGAAGKIGSTFRSLVADRYHLRLGIHPSQEFKPREGEEVVHLDVSSATACQEACQGMDAVLHLAADPAPEADFYGSLLENNVKGTYNIFSAASAAGCERVVYASSLQAVEGYPLDVQVPHEALARPANMYGVSKSFGEAVASHFSASKGLSSIAVRIGAFESVGPGRNFTARDLSAFVSGQDLTQLFCLALEATGVQFAVVYGISNNRFKRADLRPTMQLLGYAPQDDAFHMYRDQLGRVF